MHVWAEANGVRSLVGRDLALPLSKQCVDELHNVFLDGSSYSSNTEVWFTCSHAGDRHTPQIDGSSPKAFHLKNSWNCDASARYLCIIYLKIWWEFVFERTSLECCLCLCQNHILDGIVKKWDKGHWLEGGPSCNVWRLTELWGDCKYGSLLLK